MADLTRIARPWLLSLRSPMRAPTTTSPYLGLGYNRGISATTARHSFYASNKLKSQFRRSAKEQQQMTKAAEMEIMGTFLLPYTVVPPPLWRFPPSPIKFVELTWLLVKNRAKSLGSRIVVHLMSMQRTRGFGWPRFKSGKRACIPAAKALHVQMSEAVAAGDKDTLRRICSYELFMRLAGAIDSRPPRTSTEWELVRYDNKLRYPRIADFRATYQPAKSGKQVRIIRQAVVSIASVQRLTRYDAHGVPIPGTDRERPMIEHLVLQSHVDEPAYEATPWKIWGTLPEMSFERIREDTAMFTEAMASQSRYR